MSGSSSRRPETRSTSQQNLITTLIERRKRSIQHRHIHNLVTSPLPQQIDPYPDTSCRICDPIDNDIIDRDFEKFLKKIQRFDPDITISGTNQNAFFLNKENRNKSIYTFQRFLETLTYWKIPANFGNLARSIIHQHADTTVGEIHELTDELEDAYIEEVTQALQQQLQYQVPQYNQTQFPATPAPRTFTPLLQALNQNRSLVRKASSLVNFVRQRDSIDELEDESRSPSPTRAFEEANTQRRQAIGVLVSPALSRAESEHSQAENLVENNLVENNQGENQFLNLEIDNAYFEHDQPDPVTEDSDEENVPPQQPVYNLPPVPLNLPQIQMARNADYPVFDGTKPGAWAKAMEIAFAANQVANQQVKINIGAAHLGDYIDWFTGQEPFTHWTGGQGGNDRNFKEEFLAHFAGPEERDHALSQLWKRKQRRNETITSYVNGLEKIWNATEVAIPAAIKLSQFIGGLDPAIQNLVKAQNPQDMAAAVAISKRVSGGGSHGAYLTQEEESPVVTGLLTQVADLTKRVAELTTELQGGQQTRSKREYVNVKCNHCGKNGHKEENCWFKNKAKAKCYRCGKVGHIAKDCWERRMKATPSGKGRGRP